MNLTDTLKQRCKWWKEKKLSIIKHLLQFKQYFVSSCKKLFPNISGNCIKTLNINLIVPCSTFNSRR
uniref:Uncharacterized protein n=1 Tax=Rhizophora mucronata TaxID=61149 RepID=A0A2P2PYM5_RHIMU